RIGALGVVVLRIHVEDLAEDAQCLLVVPAADLLLGAFDEGGDGGALVDLGFASTVCFGLVGGLLAGYTSACFFGGLGGIKRRLRRSDPCVEFFELGLREQRGVV